MMLPIILPTDRALRSSSPGVELISYGDYLCPESRELHFTVSQLLHDFDGKVSYAFRSFPQPHRYTNALSAARAAEAAARQDCFWPMHYALFRYKEPLSPTACCDLALALGLDLRQFYDDWQGQELAHDIIRQVEHGRKLGIKKILSLFMNGQRQEALSLWKLQEQLDRYQGNLLPMQQGEGKGVTRSGKMAVGNGEAS